MYIGVAGIRYVKQPVAGLLRGVVLVHAYIHPVLYASTNFTVLHPEQDLLGELYRFNLITSTPQPMHPLIMRDHLKNGSNFFINHSMLSCDHNLCVWGDFMPSWKSYAAAVRQTA